jgi:hypothetical protein
MPEDMRGRAIALIDLTKGPSARTVISRSGLAWQA